MQILACLERQGKSLTANAHSHNALYRADIDGLRAVAVLAVVGNHLGLNGLHGGYVGVDIFFVISGFLISGIISREIHTGEFSLLNFYRRRILRILPALFVMMMIVSAFAILWLLPDELKTYSRSAIATIVFSSNIYFYNAIGYFAPGASDQPLLHTWSLGIEEQFYVFWPLIALALHKVKANLIFGHILVWTWAIALVSLGLSLLPFDATAKFYLIPTRAWELLLGALIVFSPNLKMPQRWVREVAVWFALAMILAAVKFFTERTPFPGPGALLPCLGAAIIIFVNRSGTTSVGQLLSLRPAVFIGKISYSVYLWHWPIIVFAGLGLLLPQSLPVKAAELALSILAGWLSWRFVEVPFRFGMLANLGAHRLVWRTAAVMICSVAGYAALSASDGLPWRFNQEQNRLAHFENFDGDHAYRGGVCFNVGEQAKIDEVTCLKRREGHDSVLLLGDSHAAHLWPGLNAEFPDADVLQVNATGCRPVWLDPKFGEPPCAKLLRSMFDRYLPENPVNRVLLAGRWLAGDLPALEVTLRRLHGKADVILIGPITQYSTSLPRLLVWDGSIDSHLITAALQPDIPVLDRKMSEIAARNGVKYISLFQHLCGEAGCKTMADTETPLQFD